MTAAGPSPLECLICAELYDDGDHQPKLLACHHTLCLSCIVQLAKQNIVNCPNKCKLVTTLPDLSAEDQNNVTNEKDFITKRANKLQYSFYIDIIKENERFQQLALTQNQTNLCSEHNETLTVWCRTCQRVVCVKCQFTTHKGHDHDLLETVVETFHDKMNENITQIKTQAQKLQLENSKTKQQCTREIDSQFEQIHSDLVEILESKKQAIKNQVTLVADEYMNMQLGSLDSLNSVYQQAISSDDTLMKVRVSSSRELHTRFEQLMNQSPSTGDQTVAEIQQHSSNIKQKVHTSVISVETPTLSHQLMNTDLKAGSSPSAIHRLPNSEASNDMTSSSDSRAPATPHTYLPITNRPVAKIGRRGFGPEQFNAPWHTAVDQNTNMVYVSDSENERIMKLNSDGDYVSHWRTGSFKPGALIVHHKLNELICAERLGVLSRNTNKIIIYSLEGDTKKEITVTGMSRIAGVTVNHCGHIVCSDNIICVLSRDGDILQEIGSYGRGPGQFWEPCGVCIGRNDDMIIVDRNNCRVQVLDHQGRFKHMFGTRGYRNGQFKRPMYVAVDQYHQIFVSDLDRKDVQVFTYIGEFIRCIDSKDDKMSAPCGLAVTQDHHVLVADREDNCIFKFKYL